MGKKCCSHHYSVNNCDGSELIKAKASNVTVKFKNLIETANAVRHMSLLRANQYLQNVLNKKECVPFKKFNSGIGKCAQAKQFKAVTVSQTLLIYALSGSCY